MKTYTKVQNWMPDTNPITTMVLVACRVCVVRNCIRFCFLCRSLVVIKTIQPLHSTREHKDIIQAQVNAIAL